MSVDRRIPSRAVAAVVAACAVAIIAGAAERSSDVTDRFPAVEGKRVVVDIATLDVRMRAGDVRDVEVHTDLKISGVGEQRAERWVAAHAPSFVDAEDRLTIAAEPGRFGFLGFGTLTARARLGIVVPTSIIPDITTTGGAISLRGDFPAAEPLRLRTSTGDMEFTGAATSLDIRTASGDARIDLLRPLERLFTRTSSGSLTLSGGARTVEVDTASGSVWLENLSGPVKVETSTGRITLRWDRLDRGHTVSVRSASGRIQLVLPPDVRPRGTLTTTGGTIRCDLPGTINERGDTVELAGDGPTLNVETASGGIQLSHGDPWDQTPR